ncbi:MAG: class I SAM-dependent methyltransferase [Gemmatimonadota bacterium]|jgi:SAM-dependent methyltransferase
MEEPTPELAREILDYYEKAPEEDRLREGVFRLEATRTRILLERYLPPPPATVLDVGGAAGAYSFWLADRGYAVHLIDPVERLVALARRLNGERTDGGGAALASVRVGDARALAAGDASADAVLLLGPLYHLIDAGDRLRALAEARRALVPGGLLMAVGISRFASALDGLRRGFLDDPDFAALVRADLESGVHRNPDGRLEFFTTAYMHRPDALRREVEEAGLRCEAVLAVEGPGWLVGGWDDEVDVERRRGLLEFLERLEAEPSLTGVSAHVMAVARRPA